MTEEENLKADIRIIELLGFIDLEHFYRYRSNAVHGLLMFGDSFSVALGEALKVAERDDALKIVRYWNQRCDQAELMHKIHEEKAKYLK